jgi:uncharacterized membrane protein
MDQAGQYASEGMAAASRGSMAAGKKAWENPRYVAALMASVVVLILLFVALLAEDPHSSRAWGIMIGVAVGVVLLPATDLAMGWIAKSKQS